MENEREVGKAYGFFYCKASKNKIEALLPEIRSNANTPSKLELSLIEEVDNLRGDTRLTDLAKEAKQNGINYVLEATYQGATNKNAADELSDILNSAYQSPLYDQGEQFKGGVVYEDEGKYIFHE